MPAAILQCAHACDVAIGVKYARQLGMKIAVRGGGHSYAGLSTGDDVLMIDFSAMRGLEIDGVNRKAMVEPGVRWGDFYAATLPHGLAPVGGTVSSVGVAGFTLGGGSGWMTREHGMALDNLLSAEVVTAGGDILTASKDVNPELFWGIRGSAGNLGIVTRFTYKLHPVPEQIFAGQVLYPFSLAKKAMGVFREVMADAPDCFNCYPALFRVPPIEAFPEELHGQVVFDFIIGHIGDPETGEAVAKPLREVGEPIMDLCARQTYGDLLTVFDAGTPPGQRWYSRSRYIRELDDAAIDTFLEHGANIQGAFTFAYFEWLGGANARIPADANAFPHRDATCDYHILAGWPGEDEDSAVMDWVRGFHEAMAPYSADAVYVNLLGEDEAERVREAYGSNYDRLAGLKRQWDPDNRLSGNINIRPD
jgi:FAD/FMN-containing dehydrogenase